MDNIYRRAEELAETFINGNKGDVLDALGTEVKSPIESAALAVLIMGNLSPSYAVNFRTLLARQVE